LVEQVILSLQKSLKSNSLQSYFAQEEKVVYSIRKLRGGESSKSIEPAIKQEREVRDVVQTYCTKVVWKCFLFSLVFQTRNFKCSQKSS
jgi:hypothetical protein